MQIKNNNLSVRSSPRQYILLYAGFFISLCYYLYEIKEEDESYRSMIIVL